MPYSIPITHELIMYDTLYYEPSKIFLKRHEKDFDEIHSIRKRPLGDYAVTGIVHLYGYKIAGEGIYHGFYDVVNQRFYNQYQISKARIIEHNDECLYEVNKKPRSLR